MALGFTARNCAGVIPPLVSGRFELNCSVSVSVLVETICMLLSPAVETKISVWSGLNMAATGVVAWAPVNVTGVNDPFTPGAPERIRDDDGEIATLRGAERRQDRQRKVL